LCPHQNTPNHTASCNHPMPPPLLNQYPANRPKALIGRRSSPDKQPLSHKRYLAGEQRSSFPVVGQQKGLGKLLIISILLCAVHTE
ncbi:MAG: hypothetical protein ACKO9F_11095, partial [Caldilinea sp.]